MDELVNVLLVIDKAHIVPQKALDCRPGLDNIHLAYTYSYHRIIILYLLSFRSRSAYKSTVSHNKSSV